mgnify:CR=1 FL=1
MTLYRASFLRIILLVSSRFGECLNILQSSITAGLTLNMGPANNPCADM